MSDYIRGGLGIVSRHRKKFIALGTVSALGVFGYYYAKRLVQDGIRQIEDFGRDFQNQMLEQQQRQDELNRIREECIRMISTFIPPIRAKVKESTDPKPVTERLKVCRQQAQKEDLESGKMESLWEELKVVSLGRVFASVYALSMLNAILKVQMHVMARIAFLEQFEARKAKASSENNPAESSINNSSVKVNREVREKFLFLGSDHLMNSGEGMEILVERITKAVRLASKDWKMGTDAQVTKREIIEMMSRIRYHVEMGDEEAALDPVTSAVRSETNLNLSPACMKWIVRCLIPEDESIIFSPQRDLDEEHNAVLTDMLNETLDMFESPTFAQVIEQSLENTFDVLLAKLSAFKFKPVPKKKDRGKEQNEVEANKVGSETLAENQDSKAVATVEVLEEEETEEYILTKVIVTLLKQVATGVLADEADNNANAYFESLNRAKGLDKLCEEIFQQGASDDIADPLSALGGLGPLGALGGLSGLAGPGAGGEIGQEEMKAFAALLGGLDE